MNRKFIEKIYKDKDCYNAVKYAVISMKSNISDQDLENCISEVYKTAMQKKGIEHHPNIKGWLTLTARNITQRFIAKCTEDVKFVISIEDKNDSTDSQKGLIDSLPDDCDIQFENDYIYSTSYIFGFRV